jgi:two-component system OmpR family sensor kinase
MRLSTRVAVGAAAVAVCSSATIGLLGAFSSFNNEVSRYDRVLDSISIDTSMVTSDKILAAIEFSTDRTYSVNVTLLDTDGRLSALTASATTLGVPPTAEQIRIAKSRGVSVAGEQNFRFRSVAVDSGDLILLSIPLDDANMALANNLWLLFWFTLGTGASATGIILVLVKRDLKAIETLARSAEEIADGKKVDLQSQPTSAEVLQLSRAIKVMVQNLNQSISVEKNARDSMQQFMGDASHELRTPLTVIKGYADLLATKEADDKAFKKKALERISGEVSRMDKLISDLLLLAKLGDVQGFEERAMSNVNFSALLKQQVDDFKELEPARAVAFTLVRGLHIWGNAELLQQLLGNIFSNLSRHTPSESRVRVSLILDNPDTALLTVDDSGPGLPDSLYTLGIDSFVRFDPFADRQQGTHGLGMTIMRTIAAKHGGTFFLLKSPLGGLRLELRLPLSAQ